MKNKHKRKYFNVGFGIRLKKKKKKNFPLADYEDYEIENRFLEGYD